MHEFDAKYVIDGLSQDLSPRHFLTGEVDEHLSGVCIADETVDPRLSPWTYREEDRAQILAKMASYPYPFSLRYPESASRLSLASALVDSLWLGGHFSYEDLSLSLTWKWDAKSLGSMAAFYRSCESLGEYLESLRLEASVLDFQESALCEIEAVLRPETRSVPARYLDLPATRLLYLPFDPCAFVLGGSALSKICGNPGDAPIELSDGDYLMDCYEIVREMVEDGIVLSAATVGRGGLMTALATYCESKADSIDFAPLMRAYGMAENDANDRARVLFAEVPGALLQIREEDLDYVDVQCLLQDVAYYSLGPSSAHLSALLQALMNR